jgi:uncharacterized membrane protein YfcA
MSNVSTVKRASGTGADAAALLAGLGLGLTVAMQLTSMSRADIATPYALITSFSRLCALVGTYFAVLGIFVGILLSKKITGDKLKKAFGWFVLIMGIYIIIKEIFFPTGGGH